MTKETTSQTTFEILPNILVVVETEPSTRQIKKWQNPLKLIALQNDLKLHNGKHFKRAQRIFKQSLINN